MQVVQALLANGLAVLLIFCWERTADQGARLRGQRGQRCSLDGLDGGARVNTTNYNILTDTVHWLAMTTYNCCEKFTFTNQGHESTFSGFKNPQRFILGFLQFTHGQIHTYSQVV